MNTTTKISKSQSSSRIYAVVIIGLLVIQYALGMVTNMFIQFPETSDVVQLWEFTRSQLPSGVHIWVGVLLVLSAIIFVIQSAIKKNRSWIVSSVVGLVAIMTAFYGGVMFVSSQVDAYSMVMALAFIVAFLAYGWGLYADRG